MVLGVGEGQTFANLAITKISKEDLRLGNSARRFLEKVQHIRTGTPPPHDTLASPPDAFIQQADLLIGLGQYDEALQYLDQAEQENPLSPSSYILKALIFEKQDRYQEVLETLTKGIQYNPTNGVLLYLRGVGFLVLGEPQKAEEDFSKAIAFGENSTGVYNRKGETLLAQEKFQEAREAYSQALVVDATQQKSLLYRASLNRRLGILRQRFKISRTY